MIIEPDDPRHPIQNQPDQDWWQKPPYTVTCPHCAAQPGLGCVAEYLGRMRTVAPHQQRIDAAQAEG